MRNKNFYILVAGLMLFSMALASCATPTTTPTSVATEAPATEAPPVVTEAPPAPTEVPPATEAPTPVTFIFGRGADSVQLDPAIVTDGESFRVTGQVLEPLYQYEHGSTVPVPALATGCTPNAEATVWECQLRQGVKFHDGTDFNADAVIFNFDRWRYTTNQYHYASQVFEYYEVMFSGFDDASIITSVDKVDDYTVKFNLSAPLAPFLANLAMDMFAISSPAAIQAAGENYGTPSAGAVGTGPFKFVEWVEGDHITVNANTDYWGGAPKVDQIIWRVIPDDSARFLALQAGDIHALEQAVVEDLTTAENDPNLYIVTRPALNTSYVAFNYKIVEFQNIKFREAVAHAIDKQGLIDNFFGGYGTLAKTFIPPMMWGYNDSIVDWTYDPELSKQLLADAGFPNGISEVTMAEDITDADGNVLFAKGAKIPLRLYYMPVTRFYFPSAQQIGEAIAANLTSVGINVELYLEGDWPTYLAARREGRLAGIYLLGWGGDNGDPDNFLGYFFKPGTEPIQREGWYMNPDLAELLKQAAITPGQDARAPLYKQAEQMVHDDIARLWLGHNNTPLLFSTKVSGYIAQPVGADYYEFVELAP